MRCPLPCRHRGPSGGGRGPREGRHAVCSSFTSAQRRLCALAGSGNAGRHTCDASAPMRGCA
eukprot:2375450-Pleurochrysis_carterae.AAC.1